MTEKNDLALFEKSRSAVAFALNHTRSIYAQPLMNMAANQLAKAMEGKKGKPGREELQGLSGAGQAGMIWRHLNSLPPFQTDCLIARVAKPTFPCECRSPCCMGMRPNPEWVEAIKRLNDYVRNELTNRQAKARKKININPQLRRMLIERHFGRKYVNGDLAEQFQLSENTIITYKKMIDAILIYWEKDGWTALDNDLSWMNVVGFTG